MRTALGRGGDLAAAVATARPPTGKEYARVSRLRAYGQWAPFVDAGPARAHVQALAQAGIGWKRAAALAGVSKGTMRKLVQGGSGGRPASTRIRPETATAILAVRPAARNLAAATLVDAAGTHRRLQALVAIGWSQAKLGARLGVSAANFSAMMRRGQVTAGTARAAAGLYDQLWNRQPPEGGRWEAIAASRARRCARERGWVPPMAWDDDLLDEPDGRPADGWQRTRRIHRSAEIAEDAAELFAQGYSREHASQRLGVTLSGLQKALSRDRNAAERERNAQRARFAAASAQAGDEYQAEAG